MALQLRQRACLSEVVGISWCNLLPIADKEESYWMVGYIMLASLASRCKLKRPRRARGTRVGFNTFVAKSTVTSVLSSVSRV